MQFDSIDVISWFSWEHEIWNVLKRFINVFVLSQESNTLNLCGVLRMI